MLCGTVAPELANMVAEGLAPMTALGFLQSLSQGLIDDVKDHVVGVERLRVLVKSDDNKSLKPAAFIASEVKSKGLGHFGRSVLYHLGGIIVDEQLRGIGKKLLRDELVQTDADLLGFHTQNSHMLHLGQALSEYDFLLSYQLAEEMGTKNRQVKTLHTIPVVDSVLDVARYGGKSLYGDLRKFVHGGSVISELNYKNGDAIVYVGQVRR